jgi:hypothetical protein
MVTGRKVVGLHRALRLLRDERIAWRLPELAADSFVSESKAMVGSTYKTVLATSSLEGIARRTDRLVYDSLFLTVP